MLWLCMCMFRVGTVELREAGGKGNKEIKTGVGVGSFWKRK